MVHYLLHDNPFAQSSEAGENLKDALLTLRFLADSHDMSLGVSGRAPFSGPTMVWTSNALAYMAVALDDDELGRAFVRLWRPDLPVFQPFLATVSARIYWHSSPGAVPLLLDVADRCQPAPDPRGHRACPYAAMNVHRRGSWVVSVRGWSKYVWNHEGSTRYGGGANVYGLYSACGMIQRVTRPRTCDSDPRARAFQRASARAQGVSNPSASRIFSATLAPRNR